MKKFVELTIPTDDPTYNIGVRFGLLDSPAYEIRRRVLQVLAEAYAEDSQQQLSLIEIRRRAYPETANRSDVKRLVRKALQDFDASRLCDPMLPGGPAKWRLNANGRYAHEHIDAAQVVAEQNGIRSEPVEIEVQLARFSEEHELTGIEVTIGEYATILTVGKATNLENLLRAAIVNARVANEFLQEREETQRREQHDNHRKAQQAQQQLIDAWLRK